MHDTNVLFYIQESITLSMLDIQIEMDTWLHIRVNGIMFLIGRGVCLPVVSKKNSIIYIQVFEML